MSVEEVLNRLDDALEDAWTLPLSKGKRVLDAEKVQDLIDDIRLNLPGEIKQARAIVSDRSEIISSAKQEADAILNKAKATAEKIVVESELIKEAQKRAAELVTTAQKNAKEIKKNATEYTERVLKMAEEQMVQSVNDLRKAVTEIRSINNEK